MDSSESNLKQSNFYVKNNNSQRMKNSNMYQKNSEIQDSMNTSKSKRYIPLMYRGDIMPPQHESKTLLSLHDLPISEDSCDEDYFEEDVYEFLQEVYQNRGRSRPIFCQEDLGVNIDDLKSHKEKSVRQNQSSLLQQSMSSKRFEKNKSNSMSNQKTEFDDDFNVDFLMDSPAEKSPLKQKNKKEKIKIIKPYKKFDEDFIHSFTQEKLYEFIEYKFIGEYENEKFPKLKTIQVIYKHPHLPLSTTRIEEFYVPIYKIMEDKSDAKEEFLDWKELLIKKMNLRAVKADYIFLSGGQQVNNFNQIPIEQKIIFISQNSELSFWIEFQKNHKIQISFQQQIDYIKELNNCLNATQMYSMLISITLIEKKLREQEKERQIKHQQNLQKRLIKQANVAQQEYLETKQNEDNMSHLDLKFKRLEDEIVEENNVQELEDQKQEMVQMIKSQTEIKIKDIEKKISEQTNMFRKYIQTSKSTKNIAGFPRNYSEVIKQRERYLNSEQQALRQKKKREKKLQVLQKQEFNFQKLPEIQKTQTSKLNTDPQQLLFMYNKYTGVLKNSLQTSSERFTSSPPNFRNSGQMDHVMELSQQSKKPSKKLNFGAVLQNFNKVRMKIMQTSLPNVIQKTLEDENQFNNQSISQKMQNQNNMLQGKKNPQTQKSFYNPNFNQTKASKAKEKNVPSSLQINDFFQYDLQQNQNSQSSSLRMSNQLQQNSISNNSPTHNNFQM